MSQAAHPGRTSSAVRRSLTATSASGRQLTVVAVKRGLPLREGVFGGTGVFDFLVGVFVEVVLEAVASRRSQWKVAVLRPRLGGSQLTYKQVLPAGVDPEQRMNELASTVKAGEMGDA